MKALPALARAGLLLAASVSAASAADRRVDVINGTKETILEFYASNTDTSDWEEDILGKQVIEPGETFRINIDDGSGRCRYDFKAVFEDGTSHVQPNVNVCGIGRFTYR